MIRFWWSLLGAGPIPGRKRHHSTWLETDLDSLVTLDHGLDSPASPQHQTSPPGSKISPAVPPVDNQTQALYMNAETSTKRIGNYQNPNIISNCVGYVRYNRPLSGHYNDLKHPHTSYSSVDSIFTNFPQDLKFRDCMVRCPFALFCDTCALYEKQLACCHCASSLLPNSAMPV